MSHHNPGVDEFLAVHGADVTGVISGFDRPQIKSSPRLTAFFVRQLERLRAKAEPPAECSAIKLLTGGDALATCP